MRGAVILLAVAMMVCGCVVDVPSLELDTDSKVISDEKPIGVGDTSSNAEAVDSNSSDDEDTGDSDSYLSDFDTASDTPEDDSEKGTEDDSEKGTDFSDVEDFTQSSGEMGLVVIEAEDYSNVRSGNDGSTWEASYDIAAYSGHGAMKATPSGIGYKDNADLVFAETNAPVLQYTIRMVKAEPVYIWVRAAHTGRSDDSVWYGRDGHIASGSALAFRDHEQSITGQWYYIRYLMNDSCAVLDIPEVGIITFELYMREAGLEVDQIILTTSKTYDPNALKSQ
ncbi:MAG: hypothetical protein JXR76_25805 [Deltaproteobacteria bacterium]|nr:hypothetical protein [Deltaproteobacteria bacterium]